MAERSSAASTRTAPSAAATIALGSIPIERLGDVDSLGELLVHHPIHEVIAIQSSVDRDWLRTGH